MLESINVKGCVGVLIQPLSFFICQVEYDESLYHTVLQVSFVLYHSLSVRHIRLFDKGYPVLLRRRKIRHRGRACDVLFYI